ncbi:MAG TPA: hypothetical protein VK503_01785 [Candidatus Bathyarchaeia archaeon]|nr:hypothetical protein [Candidatus Bathyarchaeia archaeon]
MVWSRVASRSLTIKCVVLVVLVSASNIYAITTITVAPNHVTQGASFQVSGTGYTPNLKGTVQVLDNACNYKNIIMSQSVSGDSSGNVGPITFSSSNLAVGSHCATINLQPTGATSFRESASGWFTIIPTANTTLSTIIDAQISKTTTSSQETDFLSNPSITGGIIAIVAIIILAVTMLRKRFSKTKSFRVRLLRICR